MGTLRRHHRRGSTKMTLFVLTIVLCVFAQDVQGSKVSFTATPTSVSPCLSKTLTLRCDITDTQTVLSNSGLVGRRGLTETAYDTNMILSIFITKSSQNNKTIASITTVGGSVAKTDVKDLRVNGTLSSKTPERAYL